MTEKKFHKILVFVNSLIPLVFLFWDAYFSGLGANPVEFFLRTTGVLTLVFLIITLSISPLRKIFGWKWVVPLRRMMGLYAFFYGCIHLITYGIFDKSLDLTVIIYDVWQRWFIAFGMAALVLMIPLAVTSTNAMVRRIGAKRWRKLHRLVYVVTGLGVVHYYLIQKSDVTYPVLFGLILAGLLVYRIYSRFETEVKRSTAS